jgi:hypothetical protein
MTITDKDIAHALSSASLMIFNKTRGLFCKVAPWTPKKFLINKKFWEGPGKHAARAPSETKQNIFCTVRIF